jgi:N-sulfoglucosamine sulfohydrolase
LGIHSEKISGIHEPIKLQIMNKWSGIKVAIGCMLVHGSYAQERPNILLITADDMNWNSVGVYNSTVAGSTPNIDRLASQGMKFDYAYVPIALSTPSRQVMLSGNHSHQTMTRCFTEIERVGPTLPDILKQNGYFIANINKQQDFYDWDIAITENESGRGRDIPFQKRAVAGIIEEAKENPWFIMMNFNDPHRSFSGSKAEKESITYTDLKNTGRLSTPSKVFTPEEIDVPGFLPDLPDIRKEMSEYYSSVRRADDGVGAVLEALKASGQEDNTIVVFMSDNGISMPYSKLNCYQTSLRVPLIVKYPGKIKEGARNDRDIVSSVDLAPTLLDLIGLKIPGYMAGKSFKPLLEGKSQEGRNYTVGYYYRNLRQDNMFPEFAIHMRDWVYIYNPWVDGKKEVHNSDYTSSLTLAAIWNAAETSQFIKKRSDFHKYRIIEELYNVRQDPNSLINLAYDNEFAENVKDMRQLLVNWMEETKHPALELMKDPYNKELIAKYMAWEKENAIKQEAEYVELNKRKE